MVYWNELLGGLDPERQLPAVRETRSAVVSAGAGSGKTRVLAVRYLYLVKERRIPPERILCMTFTKKAAAEMSERIRAMLAACAEDDPDFARALEAFPASRVSTLDAFCSEAARAGCARWGIAPDFAVDPSPDEPGLRALALDYLLERRGDPATAGFLAAVGFERATADLAGFAGGREGLVAADRRLDADLQERRLSEALADAHERLRDLLAAGLGMDPGSGKSALPWLEAAAAFPPAPPDAGDGEALRAARAAYDALGRLRLASGQASAAAYYNAAGKEARPLARIASLAARALGDERRRGAVETLRGFLERAAEARAASGTLSFSDVASLALATLETDLSLRDWYKSRYDAIMVDEFQDDNELQKRVLYCLAERRDLVAPDRPARVGPESLEPGILFFVGDEKQSIYAFRGADVTVFRGLAAELSRAPGGLGAHSLSVNWRSEPGLIGFFNDTFGRILPAPDDGAARDYEARFEPLGSGPPTEGARPTVTYLESNEPEDDEALPSDEAEAWRVAELIRDLVASGEPVTGKGADGRKIARPCGYDDIAVLFRSTASQNKVERYLRLLGVPYTATSTAGLYAESIVGDLYAMLRLVVYPDDRLALATALRGPLARLSDDGAFAVLAESAADSAADRDAAPPASPGPSEAAALNPFGRAPAGLSPDDEARLAAAGRTWSELRAMADREPHRRLVEHIWYDRGLRWNVLKDGSQAAFLEHFDYAWSMAAAADDRGERLVDLVADLEGRIGDVGRFDEAALRESSRGVSVMTVHASKGLEFPVVILPDLESRGSDRRSSALSDTRRFGPSLRLWDDEAGAAVDAIADLEAELRTLERGEGAEAMDETLAETARLFYVACTRAISRLYLVGKVPRSADPARRSFRGLLLAAWPWLGPTSQGDDDFQSDRPEDAPDLLRVEYVPRRDKADYARLAAQAAEDGREKARATAAADPFPVLGRRARWSVTAAAAYLESLAEERFLGPGAAPLAASAPGSPAEGAKGLAEADFGTLCHRLVEALLERPGERPGLDPPLAKALEALGAAERERSYAEALALAEAFLSSDRGRRAAAARRARLEGRAGAVFEVEYPFVWRGESPGGPAILSGSMDLLYGDDTGLVVVDFKTDARMEPARHGFQLSLYRDAAESMFSLPASAFVYYLRHGIECAIHDTVDISAL